MPKDSVFLPVLEDSMFDVLRLSEFIILPES